MAEGRREGPELIYPYLKFRKDYGRQCQFLEDHGRTHINILPNKVFKKKVRRLKLCDKECQAVPAPAETEVCSFQFTNCQFNLQTPNVRH